MVLGITLVALGLAACSSMPITAQPTATVSPSQRPVPKIATPSTQSTNIPQSSLFLPPTQVATATSLPSSEASTGNDFLLSGGSIEIERGTVARYRVQEQLARLDFPNDAVGETSKISGSIVFKPDGKVQSDLSKISLDLRSLKSDKDRRDQYLGNRSLESNKFPTAEFIVRETPGLIWPLPNDGELAFQLVGDMTLHGVTNPLTWEVNAEFNEHSISGQAITNFSFEEFDMVIPKLRILISVEDNIQLELDLKASITPN